MSVQTFIAGAGPYYRLTGAAPAAPGQALLSSADGVARWGGVGGGGDTFVDFTCPVFAYIDDVERLDLNPIVISANTRAVNFQGEQGEIVPHERIEAYVAETIGLFMPDFANRLVIVLPVAFSSNEDLGGSCVVDEFTSGLPIRYVRPFFKTTSGGETTMSIPRTAAEPTTTNNTKLYGFGVVFFRASA